MKKQLRLKLLCTFLAMAFVLHGIAQTRPITGTVTDMQTNAPLPGVTIWIKNTQKGTTTSVDGKFSIEANLNDVMVFSYIGYKTHEVTVADGVSYNIALDAETIGVDEVVVIGYGQVRKGDATGSVTSVTSADFNRGNVTSPQDLIVGKSSGVQITTAGGAPGSNATIRIRGGASLSASNDPLFIIDGVPVDNDGVSGMSNPLSTINPNDIESFTVLKDASATAIYGSRASNGVIIITTKKGTQGTMKFAYNGNASVGFRDGQLDVFSADEYRSTIINRYGAGSNAANLLGESNTDWQDEIFEPAMGMDHNFSVAGGAKNLPYRASVGYTNQKGLLMTSAMERYTGAININPTLFDDHLTVDLNLKGMYIKNRFASTSAIGNAMLYDPTQSVYADTTAYGGYTTWMDGDKPSSFATTNPVALLNQTDDRSEVFRSIGNAKIDYKFHFLPTLRATLNLGYDVSASDGYVKIPVDAAFAYRKASDGSDVSGEDRVYSQDKKNTLLDFYLNYNKELTSIDSKFDVMGGYSYQKFWREDYVKATSVNGEYVIDPEKTTPTEYVLISFFGRLNYSLKDRYMATFTLRDDGTSRFSADNRWGLFPSAAFGWRISDESFMENAAWVNNLKLRVGYGITGQQYVTSNNYPYLARYSYSLETARYLFGNEWVNMARPSGYDANLKWEETATANLGVDYGFFNDRINGSVEIYKRVTTDLINEIPVPAGTNFTNILLTNVGDMENRGIEFNVNGRPVVTKDLFWEVGFNFTYNQNEITKLTNVESPDYQGAVTGRISGGTGNYAKINSVGYPANSFFVYQQVYDKNGKPIRGVYVDRNNDGVVNENDKYHFHSSAPDYLLGLSTRVNYKQWDFALTGRASIGNYIYNDLEAGNANYQYVYNSTYLQNLPASIRETEFEKQELLSDFYVQNGAFFKLDNISAGYQFDKLANQKLNLHLSFTIQNLFVISSYKGIDPEVFDGMDTNVYPRPRTFLLGVNLEF